MSTNVVNSVAYLRTSRNFPQEAQPLAVEVNRSYLDIAEKMNVRTIGIFPTDRPAVNGESWFISKNQKQEAFRQVYPITSFSSISHGINTANIYGFTRIYGSFTDGTSFYPLPYVNPTAADQVGISVSSSHIVFAAGGGAPSITNGIIVLEWLSQV
jgi:hypothetical protein